MRASDFVPKGIVTINGKKGPIKAYPGGMWWMFRGCRVRANSMEEAVTMFEMPPCCKSAYNMGRVDALIDESERNGRAIKAINDGLDALNV